MIKASLHSIHPCAWPIINLVGQVTSEQGVTPPWAPIFHPTPLLGRHYHHRIYYSYHVTLLLSHHGHCRRVVYWYHLLSLTLLLICHSLELKSAFSYIRMLMVFKL